LLHVGTEELLKGKECWTKNTGLTGMIYYFEQSRIATCELERMKPKSYIKNK